MAQNIFAQYLQPVRSVTDRMADLDAQDFRREQLSGARQQNAIQALAMRRQMEADEQTRGDDRLFSDLASRAPDRNALMAALEQSRNPRLLMKAQTIRKEDEDIAGKRATRLKTDADAAKGRVEIIASAMGSIIQNPESAPLMLDYIERETGMQYPEHRKTLSTLTTPDQVRTWARGHAVKAEQLLPKFEKIDEGGRVVMGSVDPGTAKFTMTGALDKTATPDAVMTDARTRAEGAANRGVQMRGQNLTDARSREKNANEAAGVGKVDWKQDTNGNWVALPKEVDPSKGPITPVTTTAPGKRETQAGQALTIIDQAESIIDEATSSYIGAGRDQAARVFGVATTGAIGIGKLKALEGALMMAQPRMEGPQSDKDTLLYKQMAAQIGDPTIPAPQKKAALAEVRSLHEKYAGGAAAPVTRREPTPKPAPKPAGAPSGPKVGDVVDGYTYTGGKPGDRSSWKKVQ